MKPHGECIGYGLQVFRNRRSDWVCGVDEQAEEKTQITSGVGPFIRTRSIERHAYTCREQFPTRGDKAIRAQSIRGRMELIGLYLPAGAEWLSDLRAELLAFPHGRHDDIVDALGLCG